MNVTKNSFWVGFGGKPQAKDRYYQKSRKSSSTKAKTRNCTSDPLNKSVIFVSNLRLFPAFRFHRLSAPRFKHLKADFSISVSYMPCMTSKTRKNDKFNLLRKAQAQKGPNALPVTHLKTRKPVRFQRKS